MTSKTNPFENDLKRIQGRYSPASIFGITILGIALAEVIAMLIVYFFQHLPYYQQVLLDATVMTAIIFPLLYFLSFRSILRHIQQRYQVEQILKSRLRIIEHARVHDLNEILQFTLDELESLTGSSVGFFHFIDSDQTTIQLQTWSTNTLQTMCTVGGAERHYPLDQAGVWADCVRQQKAVVHNNYTSLGDRKGLPEGHAPIFREMAVPILRNGKIAAVLGVGNKPKDYTPNDVELVSKLADFTWDIVQHLRAGDALRESDEKFRTLVDWTYDWEMWVGPDAKIIYISPASERITGYQPDEFMADPGLILRIVHSDDRDAFSAHYDQVHDETNGAMAVEFRLTARDGQERWIEHICRPLFGEDNRYLGRRISNRDITDRKRNEAEILERNRREKQLIQMLYSMQLDIARDLHDTIGQNIGYLRMRLDYLADKSLVARTADLSAELNQMSQVANESYDLVRGTLAILQTQNPSDLFQLFKRYAVQVVERSELKVEFNDEGEPGELSTHQMRQLFYIFREALSNIEKHSGANQVRVNLCWDAGVSILSIIDNGRGFDPAGTATDGHYGLKFMRERTEMMNGSFQLISQPGAGTRIVICVPVQSGQPVSQSL
jgi:PAS domain S-box-containing protein